MADPNLDKQVFNERIDAHIALTLAGYDLLFPGDEWAYNYGLCDARIYKAKDGWRIEERA